MTAPPLPTVGELKEAASNHLEGFIKDNFGSSDGDVTATVLTGRPAEEIVQYAKDNDAEIIIMSTHGYSGIKHVVMGSTTEAVLRKAECPVLAVPIS
jgi:nucleotide-binding universal stress UspA family protein